MNELWVDHISFSQLSSATECPYQYFLLKIEGIEPVQNAFAQAGTLAHQLLAMWAKGEVAIQDLPPLWVRRFCEEVTSPLPTHLERKGYRAKLFDSITSYFEKFDGFPAFEVVGAEKQFISSIAGVPFVGVIDLILKDKTTGELVLVDHKSCSLSSFRKSREEMYKQLLLYSKYCADEYGTFPGRLRFNLFKEGQYDERPFDAGAFRTARIWAENVVADMKAKDLPDWLETRPEFFRCTNLCSCRNNCCFGNPENHRRKDDASAQNKTVAVA